MLGIMPNVIGRLFARASRISRTLSTYVTSVSSFRAAKRQPWSIMRQEQQIRSVDLTVWLGRRPLARALTYNIIRATRSDLEAAGRKGKLETSRARIYVPSAKRQMPSIILDRLKPGEAIAPKRNSSIGKTNKLINSVECNKSFMGISYFQVIIK